MEIKKFDTKVQYIKYKVLKEVARHAWNDTLLENINNIPEVVIRETDTRVRCCVYKERAIVSKRINLALPSKAEDVVEVIEIACDDCPSSGYEVGDSCRGCIAHRCENICPRGAITFDESLKAHIDKSKCVNCGLCQKVCPYNSIIKKTRPCENSCKVNAISEGENGAAKIDREKCISCGACVYQCPFGAISDRSYILDVIKKIKGSDDNKKYKVYAIVAPSIAGQFRYAKIGQVISGLKKLGFYDVLEVALGADMVAYNEAKELVEKKTLLTSSCCPAFVEYVKKNFPNLKDNVSKNISPMAMIAKHIKEKDETSKVIFVGPCIAKKKEIKLDMVKDYVDNVITFEELQVLFDSKDIDIQTLEDKDINQASYYGRIFARSGGVSEAIRQGIEEHNETFDYKPIACNGIEECKVALTKASKGILENNFIEGMACFGGCINGAGCLTHEEKNKRVIDEHGKLVVNKTIKEAIDSNK